MWLKLQLSTLSSKNQIDWETTSDKTNTDHLASYPFHTETEVDIGH